MLKRSIIFVLILTLYLMGCQMESSKTTTTQVLHLNFLDGDVFGLHPHQLQRHISGRALSKLVYEGLTRMDQHGEPILAGAESVRIGPDGLRYTFTLRPHKWSDGTLVTAYDYEKAWKEALSPTSTSAWAHLLYLINNAKEAKLGEVSLDEVGVKALDENILVVQLTSPASYFLELIAQPVFLPVKHDEQDQLRFNGPFLIDRWEKEHCLSLQANPSFWDREKISLKTIDISMITDPSTAYSMYQKRGIDWVGRPICALSDEDLEHLIGEGEIQHRKANRPFWIYFNTEKPPFNSTSIRQAFNIAFDRNHVTHILVGDRPLYAPLPSQLSAFKPSIAYDVKRAQHLFQKGIEELQLSRADLPIVKLSYFNTPSHKRLVEYLKEVWEKSFNITVKLEGLEWNVFCNQLEKGLFHVGGRIESALVSDSIELLERFECRTIHNFGKWDHEEYRKKIADARASLQPSIRKQLLKEAEKILVEEVPFLPIAECGNNYLVSKDLKGYRFDHAGCIDFSYAYFDK